MLTNPHRRTIGSADPSPDREPQFGGCGTRDGIAARLVDIADRDAGALARQQERGLKTRAPSRASKSAVARPIPEAPPVTMTQRSCISIAWCLSAHSGGRPMFRVRNPRCQSRAGSTRS
jgi:hypothetical protein